MEEYKPSTETSKQKMEQVVSPSTQLEAAKMLEIEAQRRGERVQSDRVRLAEMKAEFNKKIELDIRPGETIKSGRRGLLLAAENAWSKETQPVRPISKPMVPPPPPKKGFFGRLFS